MKNLFLSAAICLSISLHAQLGTQAKLPSQPIGNTKEIIKSLIDPAVTAIEFKTIKRTTGDLMRVTGVVKNIGGKNFVSGVNQQQIQIWENYSSSNRRMVKQLPFVRLNAADELRITFERPAFKNSEEFPPDYEVMIVYDPDIAIDANPANDDARLTNNKLSRNPRSR